jgi:ATP-dependent DNA ligase
MLARLERTLPRGDAWRYEPKLDGFRGLLWRRDGTAIQLLSRNVKDLSPWFPELIEAGRALPPNTVLDGGSWCALRQVDRRDLSRHG